jgi:hypothetical protein
VDQIVKDQNQTGEVFREHHQMSFAGNATSRASAHIVTQCVNLTLLSAHDSGEGWDSFSGREQQHRN